jgi:hypothetical protein
MDRAEAEAIYDSGRDACVQLILDLAMPVQQLDERLARLEAQARQDSRTSSVPRIRSMRSSITSTHTEIRCPWLTGTRSSRRTGLSVTSGRVQRLL